VTAPTRPRPSLRFRGRSFLALVLAPEPPAETWFAELDALMKGSPGFFVGRAVILDVAALDLDKAGLEAVVADLASRGVKLMGVQGTRPSWLGPNMPPLIAGGRDADVIEAADAISAEPAKGAEAAPEPKAAEPPAAATIAVPEPPRGAPALIIDAPVRSGQTIMYPEGDVTVLGHVASGSEIIAGGSIHVYGALRGRAIAGSTGNAKARIFCRKLEAELVAIDGLYKTAEDIDSQYRGQPVQLWLDGEAILVAALG